MNNKEQEFKAYKEYIEAMYGNAYLSAMAKLSVPYENQFGPDGKLREDLYLTEKESEAIKYAFPYLLHMDNTHSIGSQK